MALTFSILGGLSLVLPVLGRLPGSGPASFRQWWMGHVPMRLQGLVAVWAAVVLAPWELWSLYRGPVRELRALTGQTRAQAASQTLAIWLLDVRRCAAIAARRTPTAAIAGHRTPWRASPANAG